MEEAIRFRLDVDSKEYEAQVSPEDLEVFAEMIVRECAERISNDVRMSMVTAENVAHDLKMYFGVD
jgi:hypothetical protein